MTILQGYVEDGERLTDAIARVAVLAGQNGFNGYQILCRKCGELIGPEPPCYCMRQQMKRMKPNYPHQGDNGSIKKQDGEVK